MAVMRLGRRGIWCSDVDRETEEGLIRVHFEGSRSESCREWLVCRLVGARDRARSRVRSKSPGDGV